ncbi:MAG: phosphosulfolactate synthase [Cyanobacteria bacterium P01_E01_bin.42]
MLDFLKLPQRSQKPRQIGITHVIDRGIGLRSAQDLLETSSHFIDFLKLGWGTSYITQNLKEKIELYQQFDLAVYFGGTLFEIAILQNKFDEFRKMLQKFRIAHVEVSTGSLELSLEEKQKYIRELSKDFIVLSEVGSKDAQKVMAPHLWIKMIQADLAAGAWKVIAEARESGTAGIYRHDGEIRSGLIDEIITQIHPHQLLFEAPDKAQQVWLIKKFGHSVNLGNISVNDVIPLETLRLGLRSDTIFFHSSQGDPSD